MNKSKSRILLADIEISPSLGYVWGKWEQNVIEFQNEWYILSCAYKWLGERTKVLALPDYKNYTKDKENDKLLIADIAKLLSEADVVIFHNGDKFDLKKINARIIHHGFPPPNPYKSVDTLKIARKYFGFNSNKLDDLGESLGLGRKLETGGFKTWRGCMEGDKKSWEKMKRYNKGDVKLLYRIYKLFLPWIENHPQIAERGACRKCGEKRLISKGQQRVAQGFRAKLQCYVCGGWQMGILMHNT